MKAAVAVAGTQLDTSDSFLETLLHPMSITLAYSLPQIRGHKGGRLAALAEIHR